MGTKKTVEEMVENLSVRMDQGFKVVNERFEVVDSQIEKLAIAVQHGFEGVYERLDKVETRLDKVEDGLVEVKNELSKVKFNSTNLDPRVSALEEKMQIVGTKLGFQ